MLAVLEKQFSGFLTLWTSYSCFGLPQQEFRKNSVSPRTMGSGWPFMPALGQRIAQRIALGGGAHYRLKCLPSLEHVPRLTETSSQV
jgi:hypothetical protein